MVDYLFISPRIPVARAGVEHLKSQEFATLGRALRVHPCSGRNLVLTNAEGTGERIFDGIGIFGQRLYKSGEMPPEGEGRGNFMIARHRPDGSGDISADPLSTYPLFFVDNPKLIAVSNNALLLADALSRLGIELPRSSMVYAFFITIGAAPGELTGYDGLRLLPFGSSVTIEASGSAALKTPSITSVIYSDDTYHHLLDRAEQEISSNVRAIATHGGPLYCDLSGGMDSRLVLAAIINQGAGADFGFITRGSIREPDANVAALIRQRFNLRRAPGQVQIAQPGLGPIQVMERALERSHGMLEYAFNADVIDGIRLGGGLGELTRRFWTNDGGSLLALQRRLMRRSKRFVPRPASDALAQLVAQDAYSLLAEGVQSDDLGDAFYLKARNRYHFGIPWSATTNRFHPLYSPAAVRASYRLSAQERAANKVGFDLMTRWSADLAALPFAGKSWDPRLTDHPTPAVTADSPPLVAEREKSGSFELRERVGREAGRGTERLEAFQAAFGSPDFDVLAPWLDPTSVRRYLIRPPEHFSRPDQIIRANRMIFAYLWMSARPASKHSRSAGKRSMRDLPPWPSRKMLRQLAVKSKSRLRRSWKRWF